MPAPPPAVTLGRYQHIKEKLKIQMPVDEAAFIALHIHTMKLHGGDVHDTIRQTSIVREMVQTIKTCLNVAIEEDDLSYERLITHLQFALTRTNHHERHTMDEEMLEMIKRKFAFSYRCAAEVAKYVSSSHGINLAEEELGYIALHIERLRKRKI